MKIDAAGIAPETGTGHARTTAAYAQQWRKALEDATWQARQRIAPGEAGSGRTDGGAEGSLALPAVKAGGAPESVAVAPAPAAGVSPAAAAGTGTGALARAVADAAVQAAIVQRPSAGAPAGAMPAAEPLIVAAGAGEPAAAPPVTTTGWQALPEWPAVLVNASIQGNRVSVAMRDGSVQESDRLALFYRLRAQLRAAGLELTSLTVNGHDAAPAEDAAQRSA